MNLNTHFMTQVSLILVNFTNFKKLIEAKEQLRKRGLQRLHNGGTTKITLIILLFILIYFKKLYWTEFALIRCTNVSRKQMKTFITYVHFFNLFPTTKKWLLHDSARWNESSYKWVYEVFSKAIWCQIFRKSITLHARLHFPILLLLCTLVCFKSRV